MCRTLLAKGGSFADGPCARSQQRMDLCREICGVALDKEPIAGASPSPLRVGPLGMLLESSLLRLSAKLGVIITLPSYLLSPYLLLAESRFSPRETVVGCPMKGSRQRALCRSFLCRVAFAGSPSWQNLCRDDFSRCQAPLALIKLLESGSDHNII